MATESFTFRERLKRFRRCLKTILLRSTATGFQGTSENQYHSAKESDYSESVVSLKISGTGEVHAEPSDDITMSSNTSEPYHTWLSYTLGITNRVQTFPNMEMRQLAEAADELSLTQLEPEISWPFDEFPFAETCSDLAHKGIQPQPTFHPFPHLPFEIRMKIYHLTITPRLVHYNGPSAQLSNLKIRHPVPLIMQICRESRAEGYRLYRSPSKNSFHAECLTQYETQQSLTPRMSAFDYTGTWPVNFSGEHDMLLWTRYWTVKKSFQEDATRLVESSTLQFVRQFAILIHFWNKIISDPQYREVYRAIRNAPNLRMLVFVGDKPGRSTRMYCKEMRLRIGIGEGEGEVGKVRWEKEIRAMGVEGVWREWDGKVLGREEVKRVVRRKDPVVRFGRIVLEKPSRRKAKGTQSQLEEWR